MNKKMVIQIGFNTFAYSDQRFTKEWIVHRLDIFEKYTLQSFKAQTNQMFEAYLDCEESTMGIINESLSQRTPLPANVHFDTKKANKKHIYDYITGSEFLYHIRLDSDNLYHKDYIQKLMDFHPKKETQVIICQYGYSYDEGRDLLSYYSQASPPFYAFIYPTEMYLRGKKYTGIGGHRNVINLFQYELLEGNNYLITIHDSNVRNDSRLISKEGLIKGQEKKRVLSEFGI